MAFHRLLFRFRELSLQSLCGQRSSKIGSQVEKVNSLKCTYAKVDWKLVVKRWFLEDSHAKSVLARVNETLNVVAVLFGKQFNALAVQRLRRTAQIIELYTQLYDKQQLRQFVKRLSSQLARSKKDKTVLALFSAAIFSWEQNGISNEEVRSIENELQVCSNNVRLGQASTVSRIGDGWEKVVNREKVTVWQKPVPGSSVYEYKVYGTFYDIPARAFFDIQVDLNHRKQWDHLIVKVEVVDGDKQSGSEVVNWIQHFPYPMYSREYVFVRRVIVDTEKQQLVLLSRGVEHPKCPETKNYVRVKSYKSNLILKPHKSIDENGFDYMLTYCDDPQAAIPSVAYSWMASTGVPDYCQKMHDFAKKFHEQKKQNDDSEETEESRYNRLSSALGGNKRKITA